MAPLEASWLTWLETQVL